MQYANAAAGAAWAAARIAYGDHPSAMSIGGPINPGMMGGGCAAGMSSSYMPASSVGMQSSGWTDPNNNGGGVSNPYGSNPKQRTLWKPSNQKTNTRKKETKSDPSDHSAASTSDKEPRKRSSKQSHHEKKSKKRESGGGNDSVSSLGSGSHRDNNPECGSTSNHNKQQRHNNKRNQRQKRGLYQSYSPRGSSSSLGTMGSNPSYRHKRRNTESLTSPRGLSGVSVFLGGLIGKSGVSALHELCSKYRWEWPKYDLIKDASNQNGEEREKDGDVVKRSNASYQSLNQNFVLSVRVNGVELGRGRGGTKGSAKQDASRKALAALVPG